MLYADEWQHADDNVNGDIGENHHSRSEYAALKISELLQKLNLKYLETLTR
jgi:hypothetical protein